ncbi:MAG TPA: phosphoenolpyruvate--protein phosphotransferase [Pirellulales bacterium]|jgi:phosphotransferase system enzyme I (PtsI)|nr:phosphoenolpyruvate--protein phosphotransferase [Pirellulales bacterium]
MQKLQGIAVSPGVAIGEALVMDNEGFRIPRRFLTRDAVDSELERLKGAFEAASQQIERNRDAVSNELGKNYGAIFDAHLQMLHDARLHSEVEQLIRERHYTPEYAVSRALRRYGKFFQSLENTHLAERANDIFDIEKRLLKNLLGRRREELSQITSPVLVLAHNLTPSETANLDRRFVRGFVTEIGGPGSHTAIVAEGMGIPAVVGTGSFLTEVSGGEVVIIDGELGLVILQPDEETLARYRQEAEEHQSRVVHLKTLRELPAVTTDGVNISLYGNIEFPHEVVPCLENGGDGIGLYRTEFLYLGADTVPDEEAHFQAYAQVAQKMVGRPVTIRTLDLGADKVASVAVVDDDRNPFLGLRSIRLSLRNLPLFRTQLRAILRASALGDVRVMFPLISTVLEFRQAKMVLSDVMEDLEEHGVPFNRDLPVGMMVEVPAAVMMIDHFVEEVDFLSIGTNDLIQYTLAVDRSNKDVASLYTASDPAVLKLIDIAVRAANRAQVPVGLCGQMSASTIYTMLLLGMGLRQMSVPPNAIPELKRLVRSLSLPQCEAVAAKALTLENARDIKSYLKEELKKVQPNNGAI